MPEYNLCACRVCACVRAPPRSRDGSSTTASGRKPTNIRRPPMRTRGKAGCRPSCETMMLCQNLWIELYTQTSQVCTARAEAASGILVKHTVVTNLQVPTSPRPAAPTAASSKYKVSSFGNCFEDLKRNFLDFREVGPHRPIRRILAQHYIYAAGWQRGAAGLASIQLLGRVAKFQWDSQPPGAPTTCEEASCSWQRVWRPLSPAPTAAHVARGTAASVAVAPANRKPGSELAPGRSASAQPGLDPAHG